MKWSAILFTVLKKSGIKLLQPKGDKHSNSEFLLPSYKQK